MLSLDIKDMYTNIPIKETIQITKEQLSLNDKDESTINKIINILETTLEQNYFTYNGECYLQQKVHYPLLSQKFSYNT
mgnify:CR=1 FL=1